MWLMKNIRFFFAMTAIFLFTACAAQKKAGSTQRDTTAVKDSVEFYETDFEVRQKNYWNLLQGGWVINTMRRQAKMDEEQLSGFYLQFYQDSTFNGNSGCNRISGRYSIKGTSIRFSNIVSTKMACDRMEQEAAYLKLLEQTVSAYTVGGTQLLLRDGASNVVFSANRRE